MSEHLIAPHGGSLVDLIVDEGRAAELKAAAADWPSWDLTPRQLCDLELLMNGAFSPLSTFLGQADYENVCCADALWPTARSGRCRSASTCPKRWPARSAGSRWPCATWRASSWPCCTSTRCTTPDREAEAQNVFGTTNPEHPGVAHLLNKTNPCYVSGRLEGLALPHHYDFRTMRDTPAELRDRFSKLGWTKVVAFQTRNPMHRAHQEITLRAAKESGANLLIHPVVGLTKPGDVDHYTRTRAYQLLLPTYPHNTAALSLVEPGDADGRPPRGGVARHHPQEPRLHPLHRRP